MGKEKTMTWSTRYIHEVERCRTKKQLISLLGRIILDENMVKCDYQVSGLKRLVYELKIDVVSGDRSVTLYNAKKRAISNIW
jgi:hypothetical protein